MLIGDPHRLAHDGCPRSFLDASKAKLNGIGREFGALRKDGTTFSAELVVADWREYGRRYFTAFIHDITRRKQTEEQIKLLLKEVNHRVKNLLAVVESIAMQTAADDPEKFIERFSERIRALAAGQDLLVKNQWQGVQLTDLVRAQLDHLDYLIGNRIVIEGPQLRIAADAVQPIAMALHELATNAAKYGALSSREGEVRITWAIDGGDFFRLSWCERGGPEVRAPSRRGFGSTVVSDMPRMQLGADVALDFAQSGVTWRMVCPAKKVLENDGVNAAENK
jgi:two-component sensor histidine kinase